MELQKYIGCLFKAKEDCILITQEGYNKGLWVRQHYSTTVTNGKIPKDQIVCLLDTFVSRKPTMSGKPLFDVGVKLYYDHCEYVITARHLDKEVALSIVLKELEKLFDIQTSSGSSLSASRSSSM